MRTNIANVCVCVRLCLQELALVCICACVAHLALLIGIRELTGWRVFADLALVVD